MSRRHKETDIKATQPHMTESAADGRQQTTETYSTGNISTEGLHHLIYETVDKILDEALAGYCSNIEVAINEDSTIAFSDDTSRGRGRPVVEQLCSMFRDAAIWPMAKEIFQKIYHKAITTATNLGQYLVCFICALFRVVKTEEPYGRIEHFHRLLKGYLKKLPAVRTLQTGVQWLKDKTKTFFRCANQRAEEAKHKAWEALEEMIFGHISNLAPQYAAM